jgi:hypothetical protein
MLKAKDIKSISSLGGLRKDEELKQKVKDKQSRLVGKLFLSDDSDSDSDSIVPSILFNIVHIRC